MRSSWGPRLTGGGELVARARMIEIGNAGDASVGEGAPQDEQARLSCVELEQPTDAPLRNHRAHGVLGALQRGDADEELVGGHPGKIVGEVSRGDLRIDVALLDLQR